MPSDKQPHGTTFHQAIILAIMDRYGPLTSGEIAVHYQEHVDTEIAYNYQYIITRRMADRGLIKAGKAKSERNQKVFRWSLTAKGRKLLKEAVKLSAILDELA